MSKLSFRARALDASKPMPIFMAEELPDLPEYSAINRAVPQMPSGMEKEEECEHHLQRAICTGIIIPTPDVTLADEDAYERLYPTTYKPPRQLIHMQPFTMEQDIPDYDMDSEDERWLVSQAKKLDLTPLKFEEMMDRLEKSSSQTVVNLNEAKALLKEDDDLIIAVFDYWLNKRLKTQHPLILSVKTEHRAGTAANNPYLAFRRRTEKMQTRKNRKNDETSYEKMLKLRRDLSRAVTLLELVKRREKTKREHLHLTIEVFEKRYQAKDYAGSLLAELSTIKAARPAFTQLFQNHYSNQSWANKAIIKDEIAPRKDKRQYKKRKHKNSSHGRMSIIPGSGMEGIASSDEEEILPQQSPETEETEDEGQFVFRRNKLCTYHMPVSNGLGNWPWSPPEENGLGDRRYRYTLASLSNRRCIGFARRRLGRGGRVILDRASTNFDDLWRQLDFSVIEAPTQESKSPKSIMEQYMSKKEEEEKLIEVKNAYNETTNKNNWTKTNNSDIVSNGVLSETCVSENSVKCDFKTDSSLERTEFNYNKDHFEQDELLEMFREIKRDWLHFRPKTPPPTKDSTCEVSSLDDTIFSPTSTVPITVELQNLTSEHPTSLLDDSLFTTSSFTLQELYGDTVDPVVPFDDTRQILSSDPIMNRTFGCSRFNVLSASSDINNDICELQQQIQQQQQRDTSVSNCVSDNMCESPKKHCSTSILSSTLTSPKYNSVNTVMQNDGWPQNQQQKITVNHITNGPLSHSETTSTSRKGNKMQPNAYICGMTTNRSQIGGVTATSTLNSDRSNQRIATHTIHTLNSHSANILDISSLSNDSIDESTKLTTQCVDNTSNTNSKQQQQNNKQQLVRKNNSLVMEVT